MKTIWYFIIPSLIFIIPIIIIPIIIATIIAIWGIKRKKKAGK